MSLTPEVLKDIVHPLAEAIRMAMSEATRTAAANNSLAGSSYNSQTSCTKTPAFNIPEYRSTDVFLLQDYFHRVDWALQLSKVPEEEQHNFVRVNMGAELNAALKILICPKQPETLLYNEMKQILIRHFDGRKNKYAESIKFRQIKQENEELVAKFALRLKQAAASCEYDAFLGRMLIEQLMHCIESRNICDEIVAKKPNNFDEAYKIVHTIVHTSTTLLSFILE